MDKKMIGILEALLFAAGDEGVSIDQVVNVLDITDLQAANLMENLKEEYHREERGMVIIEVGGVFQMVTKKEHSEYLKKLVETPGQGGLSQAALETLAIVAYRQPITRTEIEDIRGVNGGEKRKRQMLIAQQLDVKQKATQKTFSYFLRRKYVPTYKEE